MLAAPVPILRTADVQTPGDAVNPEAGRSAVSPRPTLRPGPFWAGVVATAVVSGLVGLLGTLVAKNILSIDVLSPTWVPGSTDVRRFTALGVLTAIVGGALLYLLYVATPAPMQFFLWIVGLLTAAGAVVPFSENATTKEQLTTALIIVLIGISVMALLSGVAARTSQRPADDLTQRG
jgi:hypothetical protein